MYVSWVPPRVESETKILVILGSISEVERGLRQGREKKKPIMSMLKSELPLCTLGVRGHWSHLINQKE